MISIITRTGCSEYDGPLFVAVARWDLLQGVQNMMVHCLLRWHDGICYRVFRIRWPIVCCGGTMGSATGCSEYDGPLFVVVARWDLLGSAIMTDS